MSHHQGITCEVCMKENFKGRRFKCLTCFDYDMCGACYDNGATSPRHKASHPMQCILTRSDLELYYGNEAGIIPNQPQALTCPFCGRMGHTEAMLTDHVYTEHFHSANSLLVVCPICAVRPVGVQNVLTDEFLDHLQTDHHASVPSNLVPSSDDPNVTRRSLRFPPHSTSDRVRRPEITQFCEVRETQSGLLQFGDPFRRIRNFPTGLSPIDTHGTSNIRSHMQELQIQLFGGVSPRQDRSRFHVETERGTTDTSSNVLNNQVVNSNSNQNQSTHNSSPQYLIQFIDPILTESEQHALDVLKADRSFFMQDLLLSMLTPNENMPAKTNTEKDQLPLVTEAHPHVSQTLAKSIAPDAKQHQTNKLPSPPLANQSQQSSHESDLHTVVSPPVMQSKIPQLVANVRKQPKVTDPSPSN